MNESALECGDNGLGVIAGVALDVRLGNAKACGTLRISTAVGEGVKVEVHLPR